MLSRLLQTLSARRGERRRILVFIDNCGPGDAVHTRFWLRAIREHDPRAEIVLVADFKAKAILEGNPFIDRLIVSTIYRQRKGGAFLVRTQKFFAALQLLGRIGLRYDLVVVLDWGSAIINLLARLSGRKVIGFTNGLPFLLSSGLGPYDRFKSRDDQNLAILHAAGVTAKPISPPPLIERREDDAAVRALLGEHGLRSTSKLVVLHPGSDWACQQWLPERWAQFADKVVEDYGVDAVFTGTEEEGSFIAGIRERMTKPSLDLVGKTTLPQLQALLAHARLCVCVNSVVYDLAVETGTAVVVLAGPTLPLRRSGSGPSSPLLVTASMSDELKVRITDCRGSKMIFQSCHDWTCAMTGLRDIAVATVLSAVESSHALVRIRPEHPAERGG